MLVFVIPFQMYQKPTEIFQAEKLHKHISVLKDLLQLLNGFKIKQLKVKDYCSNLGEDLVAWTIGPVLCDMERYACIWYVFAVGLYMRQASLVVQMVKCLPAMWETWV